MESYYFRKCTSAALDDEVESSDELTVYLQEVQRSSGNVTETIPEDVLAYVEDGLNPDKYTRRFVNMLMKDNQFVNGKIDAVQVYISECSCDGRTFEMFWPRKYGRSFQSCRVMSMKSLKILVEYGRRSNW